MTKDKIIYQCYLNLFNKKDLVIVKAMLHDLHLGLTLNSKIDFSHQQEIIDLITRVPYPSIQLLLWEDEYFQYKQTRQDSDLSNSGSQLQSHYHSAIVRLCTTVMKQFLEKQDYVTRELLISYLIFLNCLPGELYQKAYACLPIEIRSYRSPQICKVWDDECDLIMLSRKDEFWQKAISNLITYHDLITYQQRKGEILIKNVILYQAITEKTHFFTPSLLNSLEFGTIMDQSPTLYNILMICKCISYIVLDLENPISKFCQYKLLKQLLFSVKITLPNASNNCLNNFWNGLYYISQIIEYVFYNQEHSSKKIGLTLLDIINATSVLDLIWQYKLPLSHLEIRNLIDIYYRNQTNIDVKVQQTIKAKELETFNYYWCLCTVYDAVTEPLINITNNKISNQDPETQKFEIFANSMKEFLSEIKNLTTICQLLEDIMELLLLHWDQYLLLHSNSEINNQQNSVFQEKNNQNTDENKYFQFSFGISENLNLSAFHNASRNGAVKFLGHNGYFCDATKLWYFCKVLDQFIYEIIEKPSYKQLDDNLKKRFEFIIKQIHDICWRYEVLYNLEQIELKQDNPIKQPHLEEPVDGKFLMDLKYLLDEHHDYRKCKNFAESINNEITDKYDNQNEYNDKNNDICDEDEDMESTPYLLPSQKRRPRWSQNISKTKRKVRRATYNDSWNVFLPEKSLPKYPEFNSTCAINDNNYNEKRNNFTHRILQTPEELFILALMQQNLRVARQVVEHFSLKSTHPQLVNDLEYGEYQRNVQEELVKICEQYHKHQSSQMEMVVDYQNVVDYSSIVENIHKVASTGYGLSRLISLIEKFAKEHYPQQVQHFRDMFPRNDPQSKWLRQFVESNLNVIIICDLIWSLPLSYEDIDSVILLIKRQQEQDIKKIVTEINDASSTHGNKFCDEINLTTSPFLDPFALLENFQACLSLLKCQQKVFVKTIPDLILNTTYTLRPNLMSKQIKCKEIFYDIFYIKSNKILTVGHFKRLKNICRGIGSKYNYIKKFYSYITTLASLKNREMFGVNCEQYCLNDILQFDIYKLVNVLLFQFQMSPEEVEKYVSGLSLNLSHVIATALHSKIINQIHLNSNIHHSQFLAEIPEQFEIYINFIENQGHSLLAYLIRYIFNGDSNLLDNNEYYNSCFLKELMNLPIIINYASFFGKHYLLAALHSDNPEYFLTTIASQKECNWSHEDIVLGQLQLKLSELGVQESHEKHKKAIDDLIIQLISIDMKHLHWMVNLQDVATKAKLLCNYYNKFVNANLLKQLIISTLQHREAGKCVSKEMLQKLEDILNDVTTCKSVADIMNFSNWIHAYDFGFKTPINIFKNLLATKNYKLCNDWCSMITLNEKYKNHWKEFFIILMDCLIDNNEHDDLLLKDMENLHIHEVEDGETLASKYATDLNYLLLLLNSFQTVECMIFLESQIDKCLSMVLFSFLIKLFDCFVLRNRFSEDDNSPQPQQQEVVDFLAGKKSNLINCYSISFLIFKQFDCNLRNQLWHLIKNPLLIIEQLLMNTSFELLEKVIGVVRAELDREISEYPPLPQICSTFPDLLRVKCSFCCNKQGHGVIQSFDQNPTSFVKGVSGSVSFQLGTLQQAKDTAFILLNFNLYQPDHYITHDCIDLLLRIYATKSLDYHIPNMVKIMEDTSNKNLRLVSVQSIDSICGIFKMPQEIPSRGEWVKNENTKTCMCCRKTTFTMLMRRHHCRRCGRVVCYACSKHRMGIPELYGEVKVRVCVDCHYFTTQLSVSKDKSIDSFDNNSSNNDSDFIINCNNIKFKWQLSGNITHDKLVREEFCYEHAPSVSLCLSILALHKNKEKCYNMLLYHCRKLEKLMVPNTEANITLIVKMIKCLALAMKVCGGNGEIDALQENSEIIISMIESGYESLISTNPLNSCGMRKLADLLVQNQRWDLALNVHLKQGFPTTGVMAAFGLSCLKVGCYETAREKFSHCMIKLATGEQFASIYSFIFGSDSKMNNSNRINNADNKNILAENKNKAINNKRPSQSPPLLQDIIRMLLSIPYYCVSTKAKQRANLIRNPDVYTKQTCTSKVLSNKIIREPAINVLNTLANLKNITKGDYKAVIGYDGTSTYRQIFRQSTAFEECIYYLFTYGSHVDIIKFLIDSDLLAALRYYVLQGMDREIFLHHIYLPLLRTGRVPILIDQIGENFSNWESWSTTMMYICGYLEKHNNYNALYQLQVLLKDYVRASITSLRFYTMNCSNYQQLQNNARHLQDACKHLQKELEIHQWEKVNADSTTKTYSGLSLHTTSQELGPSLLFNCRRSPKPSNISTVSIETDSSGQSSNRNFRELQSSSGDTKTKFIVLPNQQLHFYISAKVIKARIKTIWQQLKVTNYLAVCELKHSEINDKELITKKVLKEISFENENNDILPTLFDERNKVCLLILLCSINIAEGFSMAYSIIKDYRIPKIKILLEVSRYLAKDQRYADLNVLVKCLENSGDITKDEINEILTIAQQNYEIVRT